MRKSATNKIFLIVTCVVLALAACNKADEESLASSAAIAEASNILRYVPAESPYVVAVVTPLPDEVADKLEPNIDRLLASYHGFLQNLLQQSLTKTQPIDADAPDIDKASAVLDELSSLLSVEGLSDAGFSRESRAVFYGYGLLPVLRIEVTDGALFEKALARVEKAVGEEFDRVMVSGKTVHALTADQSRLLLAVSDKQVVVTVAPHEFDDAKLNSLLGFAAPASSIVDSGRLEAIAKEYPFDNHILGLVDFTRMFETVSGGAKGLDRDLLGLLNVDAVAEEMSAMCRDEIRSMVAIMPRVVMGSTEISVDHMKTRTVFELREDIAQGLKGVTAAVPGLGKETGSLMSFGLGLNLEAFRDFLQQRLEAIEEEPYECEHLMEFRAGAGEMKKTLNQSMVPPVVYDFRGFVVNIDDIDDPNMAEIRPFSSVDGQFLLAMRDPSAVASLIQMFVPELGSLKLEENGSPVRVDLPQRQSPDKEAFAALTEQALAVAVGDDAEKKLVERLAAEASAGGTLFSFSIDNARYNALMSEALDRSDTGDASANSAELKSSVIEMMKTSGAMFPRSSFDIRIGDRGMVMDSVVTLGE